MFKLTMSFTILLRESPFLDYVDYVVLKDTNDVDHDA